MGMKKNVGKIKGGGMAVEAYKVLGLVSFDTQLEIARASFRTYYDEGNYSTDPEDLVDEPENLKFWSQATYDAGVVAAQAAADDKAAVDTEELQEAEDALAVSEGRSPIKVVPVVADVVPPYTGLTLERFKALMEPVVAAIYEHEKALGKHAGWEDVL